MAPARGPEPLANRIAKSGLAQLGVDAAELRVQGAADAVDDGDDGNRDAGGDEAILDGGRARLVLHEARNEGLHCWLLRSTWLSDTPSGRRYDPSDPNMTGRYKGRLAIKLIAPAHSEIYPVGAIVVNN